MEFTQHSICDTTFWSRIFIVVVNDTGPAATARLAIGFFVTKAERETESVSLCRTKPHATNREKLINLLRKLAGVSALSSRVRLLDNDTVFFR